MVRRRKSVASASKGTPEIDSAVEVITDKDTTMGERELEQSTVISDTNGVNGSIEEENDTTIDKTESADDVVASDEKNGVKLDVAESEVNEEIAAEGEEVEVHNEKDESGVDGDLADKNDDGGNEDIDDDEEGEEDEDEEEEEDEEAEKQEDDDHEFGDDIELKNENQKEDKEENVKVVNDEGQENTVQEEVKEGNTKEGGVNMEGKRLKKKATPAKNMKAVKKIPGGVSGQEDLIAEHEGGQDDKNVVTDEADGEKANEKTGGEGGRGGGGGGGESKKKGKNLRKEKGGNKMVSSGREVKPDIPSKKKSSKKVQSMGMVFMCSTKTKKDCYRYKVLGLPASKRETVEKIYKGMRLFLYDLDLKLMYGIYKAAGRGGHNIEPKAFNSKFPSQVKFTVMEDCLPIPEEKFKRVIKDNYFSKNKFDTILTAKQVRDLCKLFNAAKLAKHGASERPRRRVRRPSPVSRHRDRSRGHRDRSRERDKDLRIVVNDKHRYREYSPYHDRAVVNPPPTAALPYGYDRAALDIDSYRRDPLVERRDRRDPLVERRDSYRLEPLVERRDSLRLEEPLVERRDSYRLEPLVERRDPYRLEPLVERRDPYRLEPLVERRGPYRLDPLVEPRRDTYRLDPPVVEHRDSYKRPALDSGDAYRQVPLSELDDIYRRKPLLDQGSSYRRDEVVQRDDYRRLNPLTSYREVRSTGRDDITMLIDRYNSGERAVYRPQVPTTSGLLPENVGYATVGRSTTALLPEYRSVRPRYPY